jgi:hypothetical protein
MLSQEVRGVVRAVAVLQLSRADIQHTEEHCHNVQTRFRNQKRVQLPEDLAGVDDRCAIALSSVRLYAI